jgi:hypothetical protein
MIREMLAHAVTTEIRRSFPDRVDEASALVARYGTRSFDLEIERVQLAILKIARSDLAKLEQAVETAMQDYRDVLMVEYVDNPREL